MVERLHHDKLEFIAQELLDRRFVLLFDFCIVRQHAHGAELLPAPALVRRKKLLYCFRGIGPVIQDLRQRRMPRPRARQ